MTLTKEWLLTTIAELEEERDATPGVVNEDAAKALVAMKLAMASLEAEPVALRDERSGSGGISKKPGFNDLQHGTPLYTAPPAPVSVPDESAVELLATDLMKRIDKITGERHSVATLSSLRVSVVEACRAAMLSQEKSNG